MNVPRRTATFALVVLVVVALLLTSPWERLALVPRPEPSPTPPGVAPGEPTPAPTLAEPADPTPAEPAPATEVPPEPTEVPPAAEAPPVTPEVVPAEGGGSSPPSAVAPPTGETAAPPDGPSAPLPAAAERAFRDGDYEAAIPLIQEALATAAGADAERLRLLLGRAYYEFYSYTGAVETLSQVDAALLSTDEALLTLGYLARAHEAAQSWREAIAAYERLLTLDDGAADRIRWQMAMAYRALGEHAAAAGQLRLIDLTPLSASRQAEILEEMGALLHEAGDYDGAVAAYDRILEFAQNAGYRVVILYARGEALREAGRPDEAAASYRRMLEEYPATSAAHLALSALEAVGAPGVDDLTRAVALYHGGRHGEALEALARHREAAPEVAPERAAYYTALALKALGRYDEAIAEFEALIDAHGDGTYVADAWTAKAECLSAKGLDPSSFLELYFRTHPESARARALLWQAAQGLERARDWGDAAYYYGLLRAHYPADSGAPEAAFREGLMRYTASDYGSALSVWEDALGVATAAADRARLLTWMGLASRRSGDEDAARAHWDGAVAAEPDGYYGLRAADLRDGVTIRRPAVGSVAPEDGLLTEEDWAEIDAWLGTWASGEPTGTPDHAADPAVRRATTLWGLGWHGEATQGLLTYRDGITHDPWAVLSFGRLCYERGMLPMSIWSADRLTVLGRAAGAAEPPRGLMKLAYPTDYAHLIGAWGRAYDVDPLLFLALVRQESRFDPHAESWAGALGLTQVIPTTGADIAAAIGPPGYRHEMLKRPVLSAQFGVWYLSQMLDLCDGDWIAALASYNGGYGNVKRWSGGLPIQDHDLFYELIGYSETRSYIRIIYDTYRTYRELYGG